MSNNTMLGGWTDFFVPTEEQLAVWKTAMEGGLIGVKYDTPTAVSTQVVAGCNYCFLSSASIPGPSSKSYVAEVFVYQPLKGNPHVYQITPLKPTLLPRAE